VPLLPLKASSPGLTGRSSNHRQWLLDYPLSRVMTREQEDGQKH
jgi:hypothetical protein